MFPLSTYDPAVTVLAILATAIVILTLLREALKAWRLHCAISGAFNYHSLEAFEAFKVTLKKTTVYCLVTN